MTQQKAESTYVYMVKSIKDIPLLLKGYARHKGRPTFMRSLNLC